MKEQAVRPNERGASGVEFAMLIAGVVVIAMVSISVMGPKVSDEFAKAGSALAFDDTIESTTTTTTTTTTTPATTPAKADDCPKGWDLVGAGQTKKNGKNVDANNDGQICRKDIPGKGGGNTGNNQNVKDNK